MKSFLFVNLIIITTRNHLSQHLAKAVETNRNPPIGKNSMVKKTHTEKTKYPQNGRKIIIFKTESIRKLSNSNFQWIKTLNQSILNNIALFFLHFSKAINVISYL